ncbi:MAG: hypothetical protein ACKVHP_16400, partial [Verrucomicrobiales bacterium]
LLAISSKNEAKDVAQALESHPDMLLCQDHFVDTRLNWRPKSENLQGLCQDHRLGLDSVIFIDDNPAEIAEVAASCPKVITLTLPTDTEKIPEFL